MRYFCDGFPGFSDHGRVLCVFSFCSLGQFSDLGRVLRVFSFCSLGSFPILGVCSVLTWAYPFVTRMRCTGSVRCAHLIVLNFHVKIVNRFSEDDFFVSRSVLQARISPLPCLASNPTP